MGGLPGPCDGIGVTALTQRFKAHMHKNLLLLFLLWTCQIGSYSQEFTGDDFGNVRPPYIPLSRLKYLSQTGPTFFRQFPVASLTPLERADLDSEISRLPKFGPYLFSGCHDRAQASYQLLSSPSRMKGYKVWIFSPERHTSAISGRIKLRSEDEYAKKVDWGYHVALLFYDGSEKLILDQGLSPGRLISIEQWFSKMAIPVGSFWTITNGDIYLFNSTEELRSPRYASPANQNVFNGYFHNYQSDANKHLSRNLARDDVGQMLMAQNVCPELKSILTNPGQLGEKLKSGHLASNCQTATSFYNERFSYWRNLLEP